jgi:hypothetical protein
MERSGYAAFYEGGLSMAERKNISKKMRFEVFKRDSFICQYCGRSAPNVILEVDHIKPVAEGGKNTVMNLITSCRDCNRGKGKIKLDDKTEVLKQKAVMDDLNEKRLQMEMMIQWKTELEEMTEKQVDVIEEKLVETSCYRLNEHYKKRLKVLIKEFGFGIVYDASEIASIQYYSISDKMQKLGGICYNLRKKREESGN